MKTHRTHTAQNIKINEVESSANMDEKWYRIGLIPLEWFLEHCQRRDEKGIRSQVTIPVFQMAYAISARLASSLIYRRDNTCKDIRDRKNLQFQSTAI